MSVLSSEERRERAVGLAYTLAAFLIWALSPVFWKAIRHVDAFELLAHRVIWCAPMLAVVITWQKRWPSLRRVLRDRSVLAYLAGTTLLIGVNWYTFIWAVSNDHLLQASLGYFINPLLSVVLGLVFLGERLSRWQTVSVVLAALAVVYQTVQVGEMPWVALLLAFTFGFYALLRKKIAAAPEEGLLVESCLLIPILGAFLFHREMEGLGSFGHADAWTHVLLVTTGAVTAVPLVFFHHGAKRLPLSTVGILQYLAPTGQLLLAVLAYGEPFTKAHGVAFGLIWVALVIFTVDTRRRW